MVSTGHILNGLSALHKLYIEKANHWPVVRVPTAAMSLPWIWACDANLEPSRQPPIEASSPLKCPGRLLNLHAHARNPQGLLFHLSARLPHTARFLLSLSPSQALCSQAPQNPGKRLQAERVQKLACNNYKEQMSRTHDCVGDPIVPKNGTS